MLAAAREAFAESGFGVPLDVIAARAGVGPGTVYRHFPTKEALFEAVTVARVRELVALARSGAEAPDPGPAFDALLGRIADEAVAKRDLPDALGGVGEAAVAVAGASCTRRWTYCSTARGPAGAVRDGIGAAELIALAQGTAQAVRDSADPALPARLLAVVRDGLRPPAG